MKENYVVCHCKKVSYFDIADALHDMKSFDDVLKAFEEVKRLPAAPPAAADAMTRFWM